MSDYDKIIEAMVRAYHSQWTLEDPDEYLEGTNIKNCEIHRTPIKAAFQAIIDSGAVVVPSEPTTEMYMEGKKAIIDAQFMHLKSEAAWCYAAMVQAGRIKLDMLEGDVIK